MSKEEEAIEYWNNQLTLYSNEGRPYKTLKTLINLIEKQDKIIDLMAERISSELNYIKELEEYEEEIKRRIRVKKQEHEHLRDFYKINNQGYSFGKEVEIIKEYEELLEEE